MRLLGDVIDTRIAAAGGFGIKMMGSYLTFKKLEIKLKQVINHRKNKNK